MDHTTRKTGPAVLARPFNSVGIFGKLGSAQVAPVVRELQDYLREQHLAVHIETGTAELAAIPDAHTGTFEDVALRIDLGIVVGGDGTLLGVARHLAPAGVPLIGINLGRLGFLTDIQTSRMRETLRELLNGHFQREQRRLLHAEVIRDGSCVQAAIAFNDVVINKGDLARLIEFESYVNGEFVNTVRADGMVVATPTGSTAYAFSAGGPILEPTLPAIALVPICPHMPSNRAIVVGSDRSIEIVMLHTNNQTAHVTFDGQLNYALRDGDRIRIRTADHDITLLHPINRSHYGMLRTKLRWGEKF